MTDLSFKLYHHIITFFVSKKWNYIFKCYGKIQIIFLQKPTDLVTNSLVFSCFPFVKIKINNQSFNKLVLRVERPSAISKSKCKSINIFLEKISNIFTPEKIYFILKERSNLVYLSRP